MDEIKTIRKIAVSIRIQEVRDLHRAYNRRDWRAVDLAANAIKERLDHLDRALVEVLIPTTLVQRNFAP